MTGTFRFLLLIVLAWAPALAPARHSAGAIVLCSGETVHLGPDGAPLPRGAAEDACALCCLCADAEAAGREPSPAPASCAGSAAWGAPHAAPQDRAPGPPRARGPPPGA